MAKKTLKRELAVALLVWLAYIVETKDANTIEVLAWPIFTFVALAFGLQWFGNTGGVWGQSPFSSDRRRSSNRGEYTDRERELSGGSKPDDPDGS